MTDKAQEGTEAPHTCCSCALSAVLSWFAVYGVDPKDVSLHYHEELQDVNCSDMAAMLLKIAAQSFCWLLSSQS